MSRTTITHISRLSLIVASLLLGACATTPYASAQHTQVIKTWIGQEPAALWESWGPPTRKLVASNGNEYQVYFQKPARPAPGATGIADPQEPIVSDPNCETYFVVDRQTRRIAAARWRGSGCQSAETFSIRQILRIPQPTGF